MAADEGKRSAAAITTTDDAEGKPNQAIDVAAYAAKSDPVEKSAPNTCADVSSGSGNNSTVPVSDTEKKIRRAERFGISVQLSEQEKRNSRAERFGTGSTPKGTDTMKQSEELKRKARAERFGLPLPSDDEAKKKARLECSGQVPRTDSVEEEKKKARLARFSQPPSGSLSMNSKGKIEPKAAIASKAGGGS